MGKITVKGKHLFLMFFLLTISIVVLSNVQIVRDEHTCAEDEVEVFRLTTPALGSEYGSHIKGGDDEPLDGDRAVCLSKNFFDEADIRVFDDLGRLEEDTRVVETNFHVNYYQDRDEGCHDKAREVLIISEDYRDYQDGKFGGHAGTPDDYPTGRSVCLGFYPEAVKEDGDTSIEALEKSPFEISEIIAYNTTSEDAEHQDERTGEDEEISGQEFQEECLDMEDNCFYLISFAENKHSDDYSTQNAHLLGDPVDESKLDIYVNITDHSYYPRISCETDWCISQNHMMAGDTVEFNFEVGTGGDIYPRMMGPDYDENGFQADFSDNDILYPLQDVKLCKDSNCDDEIDGCTVSGVYDGFELNCEYSSDTYEEFDLYVEVIDIIGNAQTRNIGDPIVFELPEGSECETDAECRGICDDGVCTTEVEAPDIEFRQ